MFCQCFYLGPLGFWSCFLLKEVETLFLKDLLSLNSGHLLWLQREKQRSLLQDTLDIHLVPGVNLMHGFDSQDLLSTNDWSNQKLAGTEPQHVPHQQWPDWTARALFLSLWNSSGIRTYPGRICSCCQILSNNNQQVTGISLASTNSKAEDRQTGLWIQPNTRKVLSLTPMIHLGHSSTALSRKLEFNSPAHSRNLELWPADKSREQLRAGDSEHTAV